MLRLRNDVVLEKIDGVWLLIALRSAWKECPFAMPTVPVYADIWKAIKAGRKETDIIDMLQQERGYSKEKAYMVLSVFVAAVRKNHYVIEEGTK